MLLTTAVALGVALAGCGSTTADSGSDTGTTTAAAPSASPPDQPGQGVLTAAQAKAALPTAADLPSGWTVKAVSADDTALASDASKAAGQVTYKPAACQAFYDKVSANDAVAKAAQATKAAAVASPASGVGTSAAFSISSYKTTDDAEQPLKATSDLGACKSFTATTKLGTYSYKVSQAAAPDLGDDQAAWSMAMTVSSVTVHLTFVSIRTGHNLVSAIETSTSDTVPLPYEPVLKQILTKLGSN